jgi:RHS repeat-associated protein
VFDGFDRLVSETTPQGSVSYQYDAAGREIQMTVAGQPPVGYTYDNANRATQITQGNSAISFSYDIANRRISLTLPNSVTVAYGYDSDSHLTGVTYQNSTALLGNLTYSYDRNGRIAQKSGTFARTSLPGALMSATYDAANRLSKWGSTSYSYDANGNIQSDGTNTYVWDARNQLSSISGGVAASFQYDPLGRRINKIVGGGATGFLYDGPNVVQELSGLIPTATRLNGKIDEIFTRTGTNTVGFLSDGLGSTAALTDTTGAVATQYTYEPFGNTSSIGSTSSNSFQYTGRENDGTGLYYYRARYYNPVVQRFISQDPIGLAGSDTNLYAYTLNSPTNFADPGGKCPLCAAGVAAEFGPPGWIAAGGIVVITAPIWGPALAKYLSDAFQGSGSGTISTSTPADPNGNQSHPPSCPGPQLDLDSGDSWGKAKTLAKHFSDHGADFGAANAEEYAQMASEFLQQALANGYPTKIATDGTIRVIDPTYTTFGSYNGNGTTKTFYKPDPAIHQQGTNEDYWNKQPGKPCQ